MSKLNIVIIGLIWISSYFPLLHSSCRTYVEEVICSHIEDTRLLYTCESSSSDGNCSCIFDNPLRSELGWFKMCKTKNSSQLGKKRVRKRQITNQNLCGSIESPKPGKVSCNQTRHEINCFGTCSDGFQFIEGPREQFYKCHYSDGIWTPATNFPACQPICNPACENGGICTAVNFCSCSNDYRGNVCQFPIALCEISKNYLASSWQCNHTRTETTCDISCHAPGTPEAEINVQRYECSVEGAWSMPLPPCIQVPQCPEPTKIKNGNWRILIGQIFSSGSKVIYFCDVGFLLQGLSHITCHSNGTWSNEPPQCVKQEDVVCEDLGEISFGRRRNVSRRFLTGSSIMFECDEKYSILGEATIMCLSNGQWSSRKPQCVPDENMPVFCPKPNAPKNSLVQVSFPHQHPLRTILNRDIPLYQRMIIINFSEGESEGFSSLPERFFLAGTRVQYKCKSRFYKLYGSEYQTCLTTKTWSGYQPSCIPECGRSDSPKTPFIVNGNSTHIGQWPWQVGLALKTSKGLKLLCGGALINELWILTAAHCVTKKLSNIPIDTKEILVFCGKYYRDFQKDDEHIQVKEVRQIIIHSEYDFIHYDVDIALLQLDSPVELTTRVQPICLPTADTTRENVREGKKGIVLGWGVTENGKFSETLKESILPVVGHDRCEEAYREGLRTVTITPNMFCAGLDSGFSDTCNGDSGGPFMFSVGPANDVRWYLEGIVSWGSESGCGKARRYSGFTKVGRFVPWINMFI